MEPPQQQRHQQQVRGVSSSRCRCRSTSTPSSIHRPLTPPKNQVPSDEERERVKNGTAKAVMPTQTLHIWQECMSPSKTFIFWIWESWIYYVENEVFMCRINAYSPVSYLSKVTLWTTWEANLFLTDCSKYPLKVLMMQVALGTVFQSNVNAICSWLVHLLGKV